MQGQNKNVNNTFNVSNVFKIVLCNNNIDEGVQGTYLTTDGLRDLGKKSIGQRSTCFNKRCIVCQIISTRIVTYKSKQTKDGRVYKEIIANVCTTDNIYQRLRLKLTPNTLLRDVSVSYSFKASGNAVNKIDKFYEYSVVM